MATERTTRTSARTINTSHSTLNQSARSQSQSTLMSGSQYPEEYDDLMGEVTESVYSFVKERENAWNVERAALIKQYEQLKQSAAKIDDLLSELRLVKSENERLRRKIKSSEEQPKPAAAPAPESPYSPPQPTDAEAAATTVAVAVAAPAPVFKKVTIRGEKYFVKEDAIYKSDSSAEDGYVRVGSIVNGQAKFDRKV